MSEADYSPDYDDNQSGHTIGQIVQLSVLAAMLSAALILQIFLFPFYVYVSKLNRQRDEKIAIFPFLDFFYRMTCFTVPSIVYLAVVMAIYGFQKDAPESENILRTDPGLVLTLLFVILTTLAIYNMTVCQILTSILALHRFLLYFFPRIGESLTPTKHSMKFLLGLLYLGLIGASIKIAFDNPQTTRKNEFFHERAMFILSSYRFIHYSVLVVTIPYSMMVLSIRKLAKMASRLQSKPEKYIAYQVIIVFVGKLITLNHDFVIRFYQTSSFTVENAPMLLDTFSFPLIIQLAYLLSNKSNADQIVKAFTFWRPHYRVENANVESTHGPERA